MPISNSTYKGENVFASEFFCPDCFDIRYYELKPTAERMTFCVIPFLEKNEPFHVVACKTCKKTFDLGILDRTIQSLYKLAGAVKCQLDQGVCPRYLRLKLMNDGLQEEFVNKLISLAQE